MILVSHFLIVLSLCFTVAIGSFAHAETLTVSYPIEEAVGNDLLFTGLPAMPGRVALLFQAKGLVAGDTLQVYVNNALVNRVSISSAQSDYGGPVKSDNRPGIFRLAVDDAQWPDEAKSGEYPVRVRVLRQGQGASGTTMHLRWFLAQPSRIGMAASYVGVGPALGGANTRKNWGGTFMFVNAKDTPADGSPGDHDAVWALQQEHISGVSVSLWWGELQPEKHLATIEAYKNSNTYRSMQRILQVARETGKRVHLYVRGISSAQGDAEGNCVSKGAGAPCWVVEWWRQHGHPVLHLAHDPRGTPEGDVRYRLWLEVSDSSDPVPGGTGRRSQFEDLKALIVSNDNPETPALYQIVNTVYGPEPIIGFISVPSLTLGMDPGQFSWHGISPEEFKGYLERHFNSDVEKWKSWLSAAVLNYIAPQLRQTRTSPNKERYALISNNMLNFSFFRSPAWYDDFFRASLLEGKSRASLLAGEALTDGRLVLATYGLDGSASDTSGVRYALTGDRYDATFPKFPSRMWWNFLVASRLGGATWAEASNSLVTAPVTEEDLAFFRRGFANAFNLGVRGYELWRIYLTWIDNLDKRGQGDLKRKFVAEMMRFNVLFAFRNRLAEASDIASFEEGIKGAFAPTSALEPSPQRQPPRGAPQRRPRAAD